MAILTSWTLAQLAALEAAYATGALSVSFSSGGSSRTVNYQSRTEMLQIMNEMRRALGIITAANSPPVIFSTFRREESGQ